MTPDQFNPPYPQCAIHSDKLQSLEKKQDTIEEKLDRLQTWIMGALLTSSLGLVGIVISMLVRK